MNHLYEISSSVFRKTFSRIGAGEVRIETADLSRPDKTVVQFGRLLEVTPETAGVLLQDATLIAGCDKNPRDIGLTAETVESDESGFQHRVHGTLNAIAVLRDWFNPIVFHPGTYDFTCRAKRQDWSGWF